MTIRARREGEAPAEAGGRRARRRSDRVACFAAALLSLLLGFASCAGRKPPQGSEAISLGSEFELRFGRSAVLPENGFEMRFSSVVAESRCPRQVVCVWEGYAEIALEMRSAGAPAKVLALRTNHGPQEQTFLGYKVRLVALDPYPETPGPIDPSRYVARLVVIEERP